MELGKKEKEKNPYNRLHALTFHCNNLCSVYYTVLALPTSVEEILGFTLPYVKMQYALPAGLDDC